MTLTLEVGRMDGDEIAGKWDKESEISSAKGIVTGCRKSKDWTENQGKKELVKLRKE